VPIPAAPPVDSQLPDDVSEWPAISIIGGDGIFWDLSDLAGHVQLQPGWTGFDLAPVSTFRDDTPNLPGAAYQGSHDDTRPMFVPVYLSGRDRAEAKEYRRRFLKSIHPSQGSSRITVAESDGTRRFIDVIYISGGEGIEGETNSGLHWILYGLNFEAIDLPHWVGTQEAGGPWHISAPVAFFPLRGFPITLSGSQVLGNTVVTNKGDVEAYPTWVLKGPATELQLKLGDRTFTITPNLLVGQTLTINTDPASQTIEDGTGANRWGDVDDVEDDLWALPPGTSTATISVTSGTSATELSMTYTPRYLVQ
jgi:hypothetical protein